MHHEDLVVEHMAQRRGAEDLGEEVRHLLLVLHLTAGGAPQVMFVGYNPQLTIDITLIKPRYWTYMDL